MEISEKIYSRVEEGDNYKLIFKEVKTELRGKYSCKIENDHGHAECVANVTVNCRFFLLKIKKKEITDDLNLF